MYENNKKWVNPFGSGKAGEQIIGILKEELT
jgi:UDP-N-acetylglucosamine 2-epimerase